MSLEIRPCRDPEPVRNYIDAYWRAGHVLARNEEMFRFTYCTPWVDRRVFPGGISVLCLHDGPQLVGFLGAIVAPYPRGQSYWGALWHVLPALKGTGQGGRLLQTLQDIADDADGWYGGFGIGPEALPVYLKYGYCVRAARRWVFRPENIEQATPPVTRARLHSGESLPDENWTDYRFRRHPSFAYEVRAQGVFRTEQNGWGRVTHACWLSRSSQGDVHAVYDRESTTACRERSRYILDAWAFECPGPGWTLAPQDLPSLFHPVEARGNVCYAIGKPFLPSQIHKGDADQDRPNVPAPTAAPVRAAAVR